MSSPEHQTQVAGAGNTLLEQARATADDELKRTVDKRKFDAQMNKAEAVARSTAAYRHQKRAVGQKLAELDVAGQRVQERATRLRDQFALDLQAFQAEFKTKQDQKAGGKIKEAPVVPMFEDFSCQAGDGVPTRTTDTLSDDGTEAFDQDAELARLRPSFDCLDEGRPVKSLSGLTSWLAQLADNVIDERTLTMLEKKIGIEDMELDEETTRVLTRGDDVASFRKDQADGLWTKIEEVVRGFTEELEPDMDLEEGLQGDFDEVCARLRAVTKQSRRGAQQIEGLRGQLDQAERRARISTMEVANYKREAAQVTLQLTMATKELDQRRMGDGAMQAELTDSKEEMARLTEQLGARTAEVAGLRMKMTTLNQRVATLERIGGEAQRELQTTRLSLNKAEQALASLGKADLLSAAARHVPFTKAVQACPIMLPVGVHAAPTSAPKMVQTTGTGDGLLAAFRDAKVTRIGATQTAEYWTPAPARAPRLSRGALAQAGMEPNRPASAISEGYTPTPRDGSPSQSHESWTPSTRGLDRSDVPPTCPSSDRGSAPSCPSGPPTQDRRGSPPPPQSFDSVSFTGGSTTQHRTVDDLSDFDPNPAPAPGQVPPEVEVHIAGLERDLREARVDLADQAAELERLTMIEPELDGLRNEAARLRAEIDTKDAILSELHAAHAPTADDGDAPAPHHTRLASAIPPDVVGQLWGRVAGLESAASRVEALLTRPLDYDHGAGAGEAGFIRRVVGVGAPSPAPAGADDPPEYVRSIGAPRGPAIDEQGLLREGLRELRATSATLRSLICGPPRRPAMSTQTPPPPSPQIIPRVTFPPPAPTPRTIKMTDGVSAATQATPRMGAAPTQTETAQTRPVAVQAVYAGDSSTAYQPAPAPAPPVRTEDRGTSPIHWPQKILSAGMGQMSTVSVGSCPDPLPPSLTDTPPHPAPGSSAGRVDWPQGGPVMVTHSASALSIPTMAEATQVSRPSSAGGSATHLMEPSPIIQAHPLTGSSNKLDQPTQPAGQPQPHPAARRHAADPVPLAQSRNSRPNRAQPFRGLTPHVFRPTPAPGQEPNGHLGFTVTSVSTQARSTVQTDGWTPAPQGPRVTAPSPGPLVIKRTIKPAPPRKLAYRRFENKIDTILGEALARGGFGATCTADSRALVLGQYLDRTKDRIRRLRTIIDTHQLRRKTGFAHDKSVAMTHLTTQLVALESRRKLVQGYLERAAALDPNPKS